ncbi:MAG: vitamin K epoxide reductase family protein [Pontiellaceae bacterium]|nr:vitamin K epoxide reductase family protein [Pontiellaceae bacterium]
MQKNTRHIREIWPWWRWLISALSVVAFLLSMYLGWHYLTGTPTIGCTTDSPCDAVLNSRWAAIGGVLPISGLAAGAYLAMLVASFFIGPDIEASTRRLSWKAMLVIAGAATGSAVWFTILQKWIVKAFCPYCMATHVCGLLLAGLVVFYAFKSKQLSESIFRAVLIPVLLGLFLAGGLAAAQITIKPPAEYIEGRAQNQLPAIDPHQAPLVGSPEAQHIVYLLFDYKCPHCQQIHLMLNEVVRRFDNTVAFVLCPSPLDRKCNPYIVADADPYKDSCELAKIALAVWFADRDQFPTFENWMFSFESGDRWLPRTLDEAESKAVELVGSEAFTAALNDPWVEQYLQTSVQIYGRTVQNGKGGVPRMVFSNRWVVPQPYDTDDLISILSEGLGVPLP